MADLKELLGEEIECQLHDLNSMETGSEEKERAIAGLDKMYKLHIEETRVELEHEAEKAKLAEDNKRWKVGTTITVLGGIGAYGFKHFWLKYGFKFEENGVLGNGIFKQFVLPWIKLKK